MSESNFNWVCFSCHFATRQAKTAKRIPKCPICKVDCYCLGYKVEVPKKGDSKKWRKLRDDCRKKQLSLAAESKVSEVRKVHTAEKRIAHLESLSKNKDREKLIKKIQKQKS